MRPSLSHKKVPAILVLSLLLILPGLALRRLSTFVDWPLLAGPSALVSFCAFFLYRSDKRRAEAGKRRIPETILHCTELIGGWPGAFLAQRTFRHKTSKRSYQSWFWLIVAIHQIAALDFLSGWRLTSVLLRLLSRGQIG